MVLGALNSLHVGYADQHARLGQDEGPLPRVNGVNRG